MSDLSSPFPTSDLAWWLCWAHEYRHGEDTDTTSPHVEGLPHPGRGDRDGRHPLEAGALGVWDMLVASREHDDTPARWHLAGTSRWAWEWDIRLATHQPSSTRGTLPAVGQRTLVTEVLIAAVLDLLAGVDPAPLRRSLAAHLAQITRPH